MEVKVTTDKACIFGFSVISGANAIFGGTEVVKGTNEVVGGVASAPESAGAGLAIATKGGIELKKGVEKLDRSWDFGKKAKNAYKQYNLDKETLEDLEGDEYRYPPRTEEARREAQIVAEVMDEKVSKKYGRSITIFVHKNGTVSVGMSGGPEGAAIIDKSQRLQEALDKEFGKGKYTVSAIAFVDGIKEVENPIGQCSEPKAVVAAHFNTSPIVGMDTIWREQGTNRHPYDGHDNVGGEVRGKYEQMAPCGTCAFLNNIKEMMQYANANKS